MLNRNKVLLAHAGVVFVLAGLTKVIERASVNKFHEKWPTSEVTAE